MVRSLVCVLLLMLGAFMGGAQTVLAIESDPEQVLRLSVDRVRQIVENLQASPDLLAIPDKTAALKEPYETISASHLLISERMRLRGVALAAGDVQSLERHREAVARYTRAFNRVLTGFEHIFADAPAKMAAFEELRSALDELAPPRQPFLQGALPYRAPAFEQRFPRTSPQIIPAYRLPSVALATGADLAGAPEAPISAGIVAQAGTIAAAAGRIHWDPAAIYNWVRENIRTEWYWGSMKGAEETLRQGSGNDADQAALLIALLRASGYPARYVRGVIEFFPDLDAARRVTGISEPEQILAFFQAAGIPCEAVRDGNTIVNLRLEHVWIEALVPYANYRGLEADAAGKVWIPLDTSIKTSEFIEAPALDLMTMPGNPLTGCRDRYLQAVREQTPLESLRQEAELFLATAQPGRSYAELLHTREQRPAALSILPSTLQFVDVAITAEYASLPRELQHQVRLRATGDTAVSAPLFDLTVPLRELSNRQTMVGFEPETIADQEEINRWGGLDNTPAYLVRLRPAVVVAGERRIVAASGLAVGGEFTLTVDFLSPAGNQSVSDRVVCGYPLLLGIVAQTALPPEPGTLPAAAPELLHRAALVYIETWNRSESELANLFDLSLVRPLPTFVTVGGQLRVDELAGLAHAVEWQGLFLDANLRTTAVIPRTAADGQRPRGFFELSALEGSVQEHRLFEAEFAVESISTAKLLGLAQSSGSPVMTVDAGNAEIMLPALEFDEAVKSDIIDAVAMGEVVRIPSVSVSHSAWNGIGYLKENPLTGEAGYMLAGSLAGGQTVLGRRDWPADMAAIMAQPFTGQPVEDPDKAFSLTAITPPEVMLATAGEELSGWLMTLVRDGAGVPVMGAPVTFKVRTGGGWLLDDLGQPGAMLQEVTVSSGRDGIARARFTPGQSTWNNPVAYRREGDLYGNIVGENLVDAQLASGSLATLATPLAVFGFAGLPDLARSRAYGSDLTGEVFSYSGSLWLLLADRFGNPVANRSVEFTARPVEPAVGSLCQNPPGLTAEQRNARLIADDLCLRRMPIHGECAGKTRLDVISRSDGSALVGVILGGVPRAGYPVTATVSTKAGLAGTSWIHYSEDFASCYEKAPPENRLVLHYQQRLNEAGQNVDARPAGRPAEVLARSWLLAEDFEHIVNGERLSCGSSEKICDMIAGTGTFAMMAPSIVLVDGKTATRAGDAADSTAIPWFYRSEVTLPPGLATVTLGAAADRSVDRIENHCSECGDVERNVSAEIGAIQGTVQIWGVDIYAPAEITVQVDAQGVSQSPLVFDYTINPAQYVASFAQVLLYRDGELWDTIPAGKTGTSSVVFPRGYLFDPKARYELQLLLNNEDDVNEILSRKVPLLTRTAAVDLQFDGIPPATEGQTGAFVLLNNDFDEKDADPAVTLPDAATPAIVATDDELKRAWLLLDDSSGLGGHWQVRASDPARLRIYHQKDGAWVEFGPDDPPEPITGFSSTIPLYLEGLAESSAIRGDMITATFSPASGTEVRDEVRLTTLKLDMAVDGNRDRKIVFDDSRDESMSFWVNNDHDYSHGEDGQTVEDDAETGNDGIDAHISCKRDLEDFARLQVLLGSVAVPGSLTYKLKLVADDENNRPMLNVFPAVNESDGYLGLPSEKSTPEQPDKQVDKPLLATAASEPVRLPAEHLAVQGLNPFLVEGRLPGKGRLVLTASYQDLPVATREVGVELHDIAWFYDRFVVSQENDDVGSRVKPAINPEGLTADSTRIGAYQPEGSDYMLFVHGWKLPSWERQRWGETVFKRLWWHGFKGKVGLFDWPCRTLPSWDFLVNFDRSEFIAWQAATALKGVLAQLAAEHEGRVHLLAHSQGNVVAGEALHQSGPGLVQSYVACNAALSAGLHGIGVYTPPLGSLASIMWKTPEVMSHYPESATGHPYLEDVKEKAGKVLNYYNVGDYALTGNTLSHPTWEYNNQLRPDGSDGYGYDHGGDVEIYPPSAPGVGFYQDPQLIPLMGERRRLTFPGDTHEIFSFCAQSRTRALGAIDNAAEMFDGSLNLGVLRYDSTRYAHSRPFRSNVVDEQSFWGQFVTDIAVNRTWAAEGGGL